MTQQRKGIVIGFEGADSTGKTSVINGFKNYLQSQGNQVLTVHLISGCAVGSIFYRQFCAGELAPLQQGLGMLNSVTTTMQQVVQPSRHAYDYILVDRTLASFGTYQLGVDKRRFLTEAFEEALKQEGNLPAVTVYLTCDTDVALKRLAARATPDAIEARGVSYQELIKEGYETTFAKWSALAPHIRVDTTHNNEQEVLENVVHEFLRQTSGYKNFSWPVKEKSLIQQALDRELTRPTPVRSLA